MLEIEMVQHTPRFPHIQPPQEPEYVPSNQRVSEVFSYITERTKEQEALIFGAEDDVICISTMFEESDLEVKTLAITRVISAAKNILQYGGLIGLSTGMIHNLLKSGSLTEKDYEACRYTVQPFQLINEIHYHLRFPIYSIAPIALLSIGAVIALKRKPQETLFQSVVRKVPLTLSTTIAPFIKLVVITTIALKLKNSFTQKLGIRNSSGSTGIMLAQTAYTISTDKQFKAIEAPGQRVFHVFLVALGLFDLAWTHNTSANCHEVVEVLCPIITLLAIQLLAKSLKPALVATSYHQKTRNMDSNPVV